MRIFISGALIVAFLTGCTSHDTADILLINAKVLTVDSHFSIRQAVAIKDGKIIATGTTSDILSFRGDSTVVIDLAGKTVVPGLIDAHTHPVSASRSEISDTIPDVHSIHHLLQWIKSETTRKKKNEWIIHPKFFITRMRDMRQMTLAELDAVSPDHPVFLDGSFGGMVNTKALQLSGLRNSKHKGILRVKSTGRPLGLIHASAFALLAKPALPELSVQQQISLLKEMFLRYNKMGITSTCSGGGDTAELALYRKLMDGNQLTVRVFHNLIFPFNAHTPNAEIEKMLDEFGEKTGDGNDQVKVGALKLVLDGGVLTGTAYLREPWGEKAMGVYGISDPHYRGNIFFSQSDLRRIGLIAARRGWKFSAHVTGGGGVDTLLAALEDINDSIPISDKRFSIIHGNFFTAPAIEKMADMNIYADMQPAWFLRDADLLHEVLGSDRIATFHPYRSLLKKGVVVNGGSDHMVKLDADASINPYNPFVAMWSIVTRKTDRGTVYGKEEAVSREDALKMYTINNAKMSFEENIKGSIEPGKLADLAVLSGNLMTCPEDSIKHIRSVMTIMNGKIVYRE